MSACPGRKCSPYAGGLPPDLISRYAKTLPRAPHTGITIRSRIGQRTPGAMLIVARRAQTTQVWNGLWGTTNRRFSFPYHRMAG